MSDVHEHAEGASIPSWFWWIGAGLCVAVLTLGVLWYVRHPGANPFAEFRPDPVASDGPQTNGHVPVPASAGGTGAVEDAEFG